MEPPVSPRRHGEQVLGELHLKLDGFSLVGASLAARATAFAVPDLDVALDLGRLSPAIASCSTVLLSHGHLDHLSGVLAYLNLRARFHIGEPTHLFGPEALIDPLRQALAVMPGMESVRKRMQLDEVLCVARPGELIRLAACSVLPFGVNHTVPALGFQVSRETDRRPLLAYGGDTATAVFARDPDLLDASVALVECTFVEPNRRVAAHLSGHAHVLDWLELAPRLRCGTLILAHLPALPWAELHALTRPLAAALPGRLVLWCETSD